LDDALRERKEACMGLLVAAGASFKTLESALMLCQAGHDGDLDRITLMCSYGANPNAVDYDNRTCLHLAASEGQVRVVDYLMGLPGIDVNMLDRMGGTPLDDAYRHGRTVVITMLQNAGGMRGSASAMAHKAALAKAEHDRKREEEMQANILAMVEGSRERRIPRDPSELKEFITDSVQRLMGSHNKLLKRMEGWMEHTETNFPYADFPLLAAVTHFLKQEAHLDYCIHEIENILNNYLARLQPFMNGNIPRVLKQGALELSMFKLLQELELYKQAMQALKSLRPLVNNISSNVQKQVGRRQSLRTVNSFLIQTSQSGAAMENTTRGSLDSEAAVRRISAGKSPLKIEAKP